MQILLVTETRLMGNLIAAAIDEAPDIEIAGCATNAEDALTIIKNRPVDVALLSARLPERGALELTTFFSELDPSLSILVMGVSARSEKILKFIEAGAAGYILRNESIDELLEAIRAVQQGKALVSPEIAAALIGRVAELAQILSHIDPEVAASADLTPREREVLELIAQNLKNREIADRLVIEVGTVKNHVHNILEKLEVNSRQEAAAYFALIRGQPA